MNTALKVCSLVVKILSLLTGFAVYADKLPQKWAAIAAIAFGIASVLKDGVNRVGDLLDDGKANDSFKPTV